MALGALAGLALPPISTSMRVAWARHGGAGDRTAVYSLTYLVQQLALLGGPPLLAGAVALGSPAAGLVVLAALAAAGRAAFAWSLRAGGVSPAPAARPAAGVLRIGAMRLVLAVATLAGAVIGGLDVAAPALASAEGAPAAAGLLIAALSVGGIAGAGVYGGRAWRRGPAERLLVVLAALTLALTPLLARGGGLPLAGVLLALAGVALNPALSTFSLLVDRHVPPGAAGSAFGWLSGGAGAGSILAATLAQHRHDPSAAFLVVVLAAAGALALAAAGRGVLAGRVTARAVVQR